jgi:hypothetical protein
LSLVGKRSIHNSSHPKYDDALDTECEDEFDDRPQKLIEIANEELDDGELSE